ncbi:MAG: single-stranded-DNA-specific exonuclease RecJ, partial [Ferruginibacter sp.]
MEKRWKIIQADEHKVDALQQSLTINRSICRILVDRGFDDYEKAKKYFRPQLSELYDPRLMKDMDKAVQRILTAFQNKEKILVFGDYDVDGTTSVACMYTFLRKIYEPGLL